MKIPSWILFDKPVLNMESFRELKETVETGRRDIVFEAKDLKFFITLLELEVQRSLARRGYMGIFSYGEECIYLYSVITELLDNNKKLNMYEIYDEALANAKQLYIEQLRKPKSIYFL